MGKVRQNSSSTAVFRVDNIQEIQVIVDHFTRYPLIGFKFSEFLLFKQCYDLIKQKQHLTKEGLEKIVVLKYNLNKGLTDVLLEAYPNIVTIPTPHYNFNGIPNPYWISGFVSGDSTFCVSIEKSSENKLGHRVRLIFGTCLHIRDRELLIGIANYFNILNNNLMASKYIYDSKPRETSVLQIKNNTNIINKIIPFFDQYPILGIKSLDFSEFKKVAELMTNKEHLTESGFIEIIKIVQQMNLDRNNSTSSHQVSVNRTELEDKT